VGGFGDGEAKETE
jgi:hypothetical protein